MPSISELRKKIRGVQSTQQMTKAMKMIAGTRLTRSQKRMADARPFVANLEEIVLSLLDNGDTPTPSPELPLDRFTRGSASDRVGLVVVTGDRGLCGSFNNAVLSRAGELVRTGGGKTFDLFLVGRKARDYGRHLGGHVEKSYADFYSTLNFSTAETIGNDLLAYYRKSDASKVLVVYNTFVSLIKYTTSVLQLLPFDRSRRERDFKVRDYLYEPSIETQLAQLLPLYVNAKLYALIAESYAAELAARVSAMDNATRNAGELIGNLTLVMNKVRQTKITV
jgi:F-type H+-transporting ATPase subunit gamma